MTRRYAALTALIGCAATTASAQQSRPVSQVDALVRCRAIRESAERLACYDRQVTALEQAVRNKDVAVVDRADVRATKRSLFGIKLPTIKLFSGDDEPEARQIETVVESVGSTGDGRLSFTVEGGARWVQTDDFPLVGIKPGRKVTIRRGAMTNYFAAFEKAVTIQVRRVL